MEVGNSKINFRNYKNITYIVNFLIKYFFYYFLVYINSSDFIFLVYDSDNFNSFNKLACSIFISSTRNNLAPCDCKDGFVEVG